MTINAKKEITDSNGIVVVGPDDKPVTVGEVVALSLNTTMSADPRRAYRLAMEFSTKDEVVLAAGDATLIVKAMTDQKYYFTVISGQIIDMVESMMEEVQESPYFTSPGEDGGIVVLDKVPV